MTQHTTNDPQVKLCECGCGQPAPIAIKSHTKKGWIKGQPKRFVNGHNGRRRAAHTVNERFWAKVDKREPNDCWLWTAGIDQFGYGIFSLHGIQMHATRALWIMLHGNIPDGLKVLHMCDNPPCVNPAHLYIGTQYQNAQDRERRNRGNHVRGEDGGNAKLIESEVLELRKLRTQGVSLGQLAKRFHIGKSQAKRIVDRESWVHL